MIPYGRQHISETDIQAVVDVMRSDFLTQGPAVPAFEKAVADYCGARHAVAVNSATSALHIACLAVGVGPGDHVWTSSITFVASANCALYCGAQVDFLDIDPRTYNLSVTDLARKLAEAERTGSLPKVVIPVHLCGQPCDMAGIHSLSRKYGFKIIEDASHAIGAEYQSQKVGKCALSDIAVFSFHPVKIMTTGEGGMALTNDDALAGRLRLLSTHGITRDPAQMAGESDGPWYYEQIALGYNYRMTDLQAALGNSQLRQIDQFLERRRRLARRYDDALRGFPLGTQLEEAGGKSSWHLYVIQLELEALGLSRHTVFQRMRERGILVNVHYIPVYRQPYYRNLGFKPSHFPHCERYYDRAISLPLFFDLADAEQDRVCAALRESLY